MKNLNYCLLFLFCISVNLALSQTFERYIQSSSDDAEEKFDGSYVTTSSSDLELTFDSWNSQGLQTVGLRFNNVTIPANSAISNAYIQFTADGSNSGNINITIKGEDASNSLGFANTTNNISARTTITESVLWNAIPSWSDGQSGTAQRTPDLSSIVAEVISSNGWQNGNPITFVITGTGNSEDFRKTYSFDEDPTKSAKLVIEYSSLSNVDLAINEFIAPREYNYPNATSVVQLEIFSFGQLEANSYTVSYSIDGNLIATEPGTVALTQGQSTEFTFSQTADLSVVGTYNLTAEVNIVNDEDVVNNTISETITVLNEIETIFFGQGSSWRFWDLNSNPDETWNTEGYDDSSWLVGAGHFGFGDGDEQTELNDGSVDYYFRKKIEISAVGQLNEVYVHMVHDDAAIIYINGAEVARSELMPATTITSSVNARQSNNSSTENEFYTYKIDPINFVTGVNTIAVSVRNRYSTDADVSFDCYVTANFSYDQDGPYVYYEGNDIIVKEVTAIGVVSNTYTSTAGLVMTCSLPHMNTSFSFPLKSQIEIESSEYEATPSKFLTISDFDGHIEGFTMVLKGEGIIDENFNWTYGDGHLIISGDLFDRGFHVTECMWLLYKLESEAEAQGGKVHLVIGNHEMFNMTDDWRYVEVKYFNNAHLMGKRMSELYDSNTELGRWLRSKNIIERIGNYAFTHGGISPEMSALNLTYDQINDYGRMEMNGTCTTSECNEVTGSDGLYWYRGMAYEELTQQQVDDFVTGFGVERVIIGHTKDDTPRSLYEGRVLAIDMYHVDNFENGFMNALQFELGCFYIFQTDNVNQTYSLLDECDDFLNSIDVNGKGQLQIYPNPTNSLLNIKLAADMLESYNYTIVNIEGKVVSSGKINTELSSINLKTYTAGKYFLTLKNSKRKVTGHFILND